VYGVGAQGEHCPATISDLLGVPIWFAVIPDSSATALWQLPSEKSSSEAGETCEKQLNCVYEVSFILVCRKTLWQGRQLYPPSPEKVVLPKAVPQNSMEAQCGEEVSLYSFMTSQLDGVSGQDHAPAALYPREETPGTHSTGGGWAPEPVWTQRLEEKSFASAGCAADFCRPQKCTVFGRVWTRES
jgi:hypothetical protein